MFFNTFFVMLQFDPSLKKRQVRVSPVQYITPHSDEPVPNSLTEKDCCHNLQRIIIHWTSQNILTFTNCLITYISRFISKIHFISPDYIFLPLGVKTAEPVKGHPHGPGHTSNNSCPLWSRVQNIDSFSPFPANTRTMNLNLNQNPGFTRMVYDFWK